MNDRSEATVMKSGETCIQTVLSRTASGLLVNVWALPRVEDFVRSLGSGELIDVQTIGRHWSRPHIRSDSGVLTPNPNKLMVYDMSVNLGPLSSSDGTGYIIHRPGYPLNVAAEDGGRISMKGDEVINLSFLRLAGISEPGGIAFVIRGPNSLENASRLARQIESATGRFYREFMKPFKLVVTVSTMPIPDGL